MQLPKIWELFLNREIDFQVFYKNLKEFLDGYEYLIPRQDLIFNVFHYIKPEDVRCVLYGEDPYPRLTSANGVAFWDQEIKSWNDKTNGNSLKNILKALLVARGPADYSTPISTCREIAASQKILTPPQMFELWLSQGVLLLNTSLTFAGNGTKKEHFAFWQPFHQALIKSLNKRPQSPHYILWGKKSQKWEEAILHSIDDSDKIIKQGHPTFIHQFLKKEELHYSPFTEIQEKIQINWL